MSNLYVLKSFVSCELSENKNIKREIIFFFWLVVEATLSREDLGLPTNWETVEDWLNETRDIAAPLDMDPPPMDVKNPEVNVLPRYDVPAPPQFWEKFPKIFPTAFESR